MVKLSLQCAIVGQEGDSFEVEIDDGVKVSKLKEIVKAGSDGIITGPYPNLQLFLAKAEGGAWLSSLTEDVKQLKKGEKTALVKSLTQEDKKLQGESGLEKVLEGMRPPSTDEIHVLVVLPDRQQAASVMKQRRYKGMSTEASCRKFLDALAQKLANLYDFECWYTSPTIGDVFRAIDNKSWSHRSSRGGKIKQKDLPAFFSDSKWKTLRTLNSRTNGRIHDGVVPKTSKGHPYVILPHDFCSDVQVNDLKEMAALVMIGGIFSPEELEVKDEDEFSGSSRSSSAHSDGA